MTSLRDLARAHLALARFDHLTKNVFVLPGAVVALSAVGLAVEVAALAWRALAALAACSLVACANYVLNEVLDAPYDRLHPFKKSRPAASGRVNRPLAFVQWILMAAAGVALGFRVSAPLGYTVLALWAMGCVYNIPPVRTKDLPFVDVLSEAVNNPLRLLVGWYAVTDALLPPTSLAVSYWMTGCYFMALKRFSEYRQIGAAAAAAYRPSFRWYTERTMLVSVMFYAAAGMLFFGAFIARYRLELVLAFPLVAVVMAAYLFLSFEPDGAVQHPERLHREHRLVVPVVVTALALVVLMFVDVPALHHAFTSTPFAHLP
jgi:4-hydroxybenzoate polyprenyltransferase